MTPWVRLPSASCLADAAPASYLLQNDAFRDLVALTLFWLVMCAVFCMTVSSIVVKLLAKAICACGSTAAFLWGLLSSQGYHASCGQQCFLQRRHLHAVMCSRLSHDAGTELRMSSADGLGCCKACLAPAPALHAHHILGQQNR